MAMKDIVIIGVGKIKTPFWKEAAAHYCDRLNRTGRLELIQVHDADPALPLPVRRERESRALLKRIPPGREAIALDETGKSMSSEAFARLLQSLAETGRPPCFLVGGPYGLDQTARAEVDHLLSLSPMTFTHEAALVFLLEQIYRAGQILAGTGYHH